jgi:large subunit ribosomal protein L20
VKGLKEAKVEINRKMLAEIAIHDPKAFTQIVAIADKALPAKVSRMK